MTPSDLRDYRANRPVIALGTRQKGIRAMAELVYEGECCECCLLMIANGDDSGCRDYYNHDHPGPMPERIAEGYAIASSWPPAFGDDDWTEQDIEMGIDRESRVSVGPCELCGQGNGYMDMYPFAIIK